jgi:hypothetical protein
MADTAGDELGLLCAELPALRALAAQHGLGDELDSLVRDVRAGGDVGGRRVELLRRLGIPAAEARRRPLLRPPGLGDGRPTAEVYGCPAGCCSRVWVRPPGDPVTTCSVYEKPLSHRSTRS